MVDQRVVCAKAEADIPIPNGPLRAWGRSATCTIAGLGVPPGMPSIGRLIGQTTLRTQRKYEHVTYSPSALPRGVPLPHAGCDSDGLILGMDRRRAWLYRGYGWASMDVRERLARRLASAAPLHQALFLRWNMATAQLANWPAQVNPAQWCKS